MTIPPGDVRRAFAQHGLRFHHEIFEDLVQCGAHVHIAIGKRRPIMQNKQLSAPSRFLNLLVKVSFFPSLEHIWLAHGKVRLHRKIRARQVQRVFVILCHGEWATLTSVNRQGNVAGKPSDRQATTNLHSGAVMQLRLRSLKARAGMPGPCGASPHTGPSD